MDVPLWQKISLRVQQALFDVKQQQAFLEDIASLVEDGVSLKQALETCVKVNQGAEQVLAKAMLDEIAQGNHVAEAMTGWYPPAIVDIIRAGEEGGILAQTLHTAAAGLTKRESAFSALFSMFVYPLTVLCMALGVSVFINHSIFDSFRAITPVSHWPDNAKTLAGIADFVQHWWWLIILSLGIIIFLFMRFMRDYIGDARPWLDKLPIWSLYRQLNAARFMETLGLLIANGLILKRSLKILQYRADPYLASHLLLMEHRLSAGRDNIADVLDTGLISQNDLSRLRLIAQSKGFEHALVRQGQRAADAGSKSIRLTGRLISGAMLASTAMFAIFMITAVYSAGFSVVPGS